MFTGIYKTLDKRYNLNLNILLIPFKRYKFSLNTTYIVREKNLFTNPRFELPESNVEPSVY